MRAVKVLLGSGIVALGLVACGGGGNHSSVAAADGYLAATSQAVSFIQWSEQGSKLHGSIEYAGTMGAPPNETVAPSHISVDATVTGSGISLTAGPDGRYSGTVNRNELVVNPSTQGGPLVASDFHAATPAAYNRAVNVLRHKVAFLDAGELLQQSHTVPAHPPAQ